MKKITILAAVVALLGSCAQNTEDTINPNTKVEGRTIYATFDNEEEQTKTYVENYKYLRWHAGDEISFFDATTHNNQYAFAGKDGDAEGEFNAVATGEGTAIATTYGVYPYNANTTISTDGVLSVELPAIQAYGVNSFGKGANTMVAVGKSATDDKLFFKNACGYLVVKLYNESGATVKSVVLKGNNEEKIAGAATITATHAGIPSVTMADTATTAVTIDCGEGVELGTTAETATEFWFALPEITFEGGITITATATEGVFETMTTKPVTITRNNVQPMKALSCKFVIPETWKIYYTATTKIEKQSWSKTTFGANIVSNEWDSATGKGVITFDGEVTTIGERAFDRDTNLTGNIIPNSVTSIGMYAFYGCSGMISIDIPTSIKTIGKMAFYNCSGLTKVNITDLSAWCRISFAGQSSNPLYCAQNLYVNQELLTDLTVPTDIVSIKQYVFHNCDCLGTITLPSHVTFVGQEAFSNCNGLTQTTIEGAKSYGQYSFDGCVGELIVNGDIPSASSYLRGVFNSAKFTKVTIGESTTSIGDYAFYSCSELTEVWIPQSITQIGVAAFRDTGSSTKLRKIYCKAQTPPAIQYMYSSSGSFPFNEEMKIYVPQDAYNNYMQYESSCDGVYQTNWYAYESYIEPYDFE